MNIHPDTSRVRRLRSAGAVLALAVASAFAPSVRAADGAAAADRSADTGTDGGAGRSAGRMIDDATITTRIKASFVGSKDVKARDIQVETRQGVVQLSGFADSREEAERAAEIARTTPGVKSVTNSIQMQPAASR